MKGEKTHCDELPWVGFYLYYPYDNWSLEVLNNLEKPVILIWIYEGSKCTKRSLLYCCWTYVTFNHNVPNVFLIVRVELLTFLRKTILPTNNVVPKSMFEAKKPTPNIGLNYSSIHACLDEHVLFWKEHDWPTFSWTHFGHWSLGFLVVNEERLSFCYSNWKITLNALSSQRGFMLGRPC